ncbi:hypothetical protein H0X32_02875 [Patescibacteria group bacterium]|nr:hypothetical protein [Patescibacteria group bacterium]
MTTESIPTNTSQKISLPHHHISARLTRDVTSILSTCIHHFQEEEREIQESSFDVDAVVSGRSVPTRSTFYKSVTPPASRRVVPIHPSAYSLRVPERGNFIPASHFNFRTA